MTGPSYVWSAVGSVPFYPHHPPPPNSPAALHNSVAQIRFGDARKLRRSFSQPPPPWPQTREICQSSRTFFFTPSASACDRGCSPSPHPSINKMALSSKLSFWSWKKKKKNYNNGVSHYLMRMSSVIALTTKRTSAFKHVHPRSLKGRCGSGRDSSGLNRHLRRSFSGKVTLQRCPFQTPSSPSTAKCVLLLNWAVGVGGSYHFTA